MMCFCRGSAAGVSMDVYEVRGHLDVIAEELTASEEEEEAADEEAFVMVQDSPDVSTLADAQQIKVRHRYTST